MLSKLLSVFLGVVLWGLGAYLDVVVALGRYGLGGLLAGAFIALVLLMRKAFGLKKTSLDLWVLIFRGLALETLLFPIANLVMVYMLNKSLPYDETKAVLIVSCLITAILAGAFFLVAYLLKTKIQRLRTGLSRKESEG
ncbi:hypothetical protein REC12_02985 [Desulfosporosinus sp. PR]|uniref:hypothetical protein n=1 Tax=Candidatus Desulfosporosinus nitrosoreducens TaxID=3401928 RepID=UPI0027EEB445|nr:hypothetical protein [Desulfosporosinus sp. PR]MDQ7092551.1 hypothetical protein [Desulfosporosinus sp. PR]